MTSRARFLAAVAAGTAASAFPVASFAQSRKPLSVGYVPSTLFAPIFVAAERGYLRTIDAVFTSAPFTELFAKRRLGTIVGAPPAGIAGSGIFFGPALLHDRDDASAVLTAFRKAAADLAGLDYFDAANLEACAKYTKQPVELIRRSPRYDFKSDLRIDQGTLEDMQREFLADNVLTYKQPLNEVRLVARF